MKKSILLVLLGLFTLSCQTQKISSTPSNDLISFKIVQINDVYEIDAINAGRSGGLARVAHIRDSIQKVNPNTFYFLAGDFLNPSLLGTIKVDGERLQGKQMVEVLNVSDLDLVTFGNHEFDLKESDLIKRLNESEFKWTSANTWHAQADGHRPFEIVKGNSVTQVSDYEIFTVENSSGKALKFGVFGVTIPSNPKDYVVYGDMFDEAERAYREASKESDFVLGLTHVSLELDKEIARRIPDLPLIMGGHEHHNMLEREGKTIIAKADANVVSLFVHTFEYNVNTKELNFDSELIMVTDAHQSNPKVQRVVDRWNNILDENLRTIIDNPNEVVFTAVEPLDGTDAGSRSKQTNLGEMITRAMSYAYNDEVDAAITNGGGIRIDDTLEGDLTSKDVFRIMPFGGSIYIVEMTGSLLTEVLEFGENASGTGAYLQRYNLSKHNSGQWLLGGKLIDSNKVYKIALNDFLMLGLDIPFLTPENEGVKSVSTPHEKDLSYDLRRAIIHYMKTEMN